MGLEITAFNRLTRVRDYDPNTDRGNNETILWVDKCPEQADRLISGVYRIDGDSMSFWTGSYSKYRWWRDHLCRMAHGCECETFLETCSDEDAPEAFRELINVWDCKITIGPKTSLKLFGDFEAFMRRIDDYADIMLTGADWRKICLQFRGALKFAAEGGAVKFC